MSPNPAFSRLRFRQVHLDFHTSEHVPDIGAKFSKAQFQDALKLGRVDSINLFSKCHHGWSYHPTKVGRTHPGLKFDLFAAQLAASREIGIKTVGYISAGFDELYIKQHPGHIVLGAEGYDPLNIGYKRLCFNTAYLEYFVAQCVEMVRDYPLSGVWTDIVGLAPCVCRKCQSDLRARGQDPANPHHVMQLAVEVQRNFFARVNSAIHAIRPDALIFHNQGHIPKGDHVAMDAMTHLELESLPTGGWGYDHFPVSAKYSATQPKEMIGMTGKFHTTWGEFGGFKHPNALRFECAAMLAYGARCCIGDQLHPNGIMNLDTYARIGLAYDEVEAKEAYCVDARPAAEIALLAIESLGDIRVNDAHIADRDIKADTGASRVLLEAQVMFDIIDTAADYTKYRLIILPDDGRLTDEQAAKLQRFLDQGGKLLLSGESGMRKEADTFHFSVGTPVGRSGTDMEYVRLSPEFLVRAQDPELVAAPFVINGDSWQVRPPATATVLGELHRPYFNRDHRHFTSLQHAPAQEPTGFPAAFVSGNILYFAPKLFGQYALRASLLYRQFLRHALDAFLDGAPTRTSMPSAGRVSLMHQPSERRYVFHALYATPIRRGDSVFPRWGIKSIEVIEDMIPLREVRCDVRVPTRLTAVCLAPSGEALPFTQSENGTVTFTLPRLECHQMVALAY